MTDKLFFLNLTNLFYAYIQPPLANYQAQTKKEVKIDRSNAPDNLSSNQIACTIPMPLEMLIFSNKSVYNLTYGHP